MVLIQILDSGDKTAKGFLSESGKFVDFFYIPKGATVTPCGGTRYSNNFQVKVENLYASLIEIKFGGHGEAIEIDLNGLQCVLRNMNATYVW